MRAPQATERPWLPSVAQVTVRSAHSAQRGLGEIGGRDLAAGAAAHLARQQARHRIGTAKRLEAAETEARAFVLVVDGGHAQARGRAGSATSGVGW